MRVVLPVGSSCEVDGIVRSSLARAEPSSTCRADVDRVRALGDELTLVGIAALPLLVELVTAAGAAGFRDIVLRTSARTLATGGAVERLRAAGLTGLLVALHGSTAACHDYHRARAGDFAATLGALGAARAVGLPVGVTTIVTRSSFRELGRLGPLLAEHGVAGWLLGLAAGIDDADPRFVPLVPRLGLALPYVLHALDRALALDLASWIRGAPLCRLGSLSRRSLACAPRVWAGCCERCAARGRCSGLDAAYLRRYGARELAPLAAEPPPIDADPRATSRLLLADER